MDKRTILAVVLSIAIIGVSFLVQAIFFPQERKDESQMEEERDEETVEMDVEIDAIMEKQDYEVLCKKSFGRDLKTSLLIRNKINNMKDEDFNYLVKLVNQQRIKNILSKYERDYAFKILFSVLIREPRFLKFLFI